MATQHGMGGWGMRASVFGMVSLIVVSWHGLDGQDQGFFKDCSFFLHSFRHEQQNKWVRWLLTAVSWGPIASCVSRIKCGFEPSLCCTSTLRALGATAQSKNVILGGGGGETPCVRVHCADVDQDVWVPS